MQVSSARTAAETIKKQATNSAEIDLITTLPPAFQRAPMLNLNAAELHDASGILMLVHTYICCVSDSMLRTNPVELRNTARH